MKQITELHQLEYEDLPQVVVNVPGIYTLLGEFSDYCKGYALCGAAPLTLEVAISMRADQGVRLFTIQGNDRKRFSLQNLKFRREDRWGNYIKGVVAGIISRGYSVSGFNLTLSGSLLKSEGSVVASSMCLGAAMAVRTLFSLPLTPDDLASVSYVALSSFSGETCRYINFLAMTRAREGSLMLFDVQHLSFEYVPFPKSESNVTTLIVESKISPHALQDELVLKRRESKATFEKLRTVFPNGLLRDIAEQDLKELTTGLTEDEKRICLYVLLESRLAKEGARLLAQNDMVLYGKVLNKVQAGLRDSFEVTCPEIDWLTKRAMETSGCLGATMITTGSSGTILVLIVQDAIASYTSRMEDYEHIFGFCPRWIVYQPQGDAKICLNG
ncbi:MAG: galactokinase [Sphaerochaetaceae bacterium]